MYDKDFINQCKKYVYENTIYSMKWITSLTPKKLLAIYFNLKNKKKG